MIDLEPREAWFVTGSQHLYGDDVLRQVAENSRRIAAALSARAGFRSAWSSSRC